MELDENRKMKIRQEDGRLEDILKEHLRLDSVKLIPCGRGSTIDAAREQWSDGSNTLAIGPGEVVVYSRNYVTNEILQENGVKLAICTDHPVIPVQYLPLSAQAAVKGGLRFEEALKSLTINAAEILGISDVTGSIAEGKHADLQLYRIGENPLDLMSEPSLVMIDGKIVAER